MRTDVEVVCLPKDLPEYFEVDISELELDEMLHLSDIKMPEGVEIPELAQGPEHDHADRFDPRHQGGGDRRGRRRRAVEGEEGAAEGEEGAAEGEAAAESGDGDKSDD